MRPTSRFARGWGNLNPGSVSWLADRRRCGRLPRPASGGIVVAGSPLTVARQRRILTGFPSPGAHIQVCPGV